jgi:transcription antitermination factor NusA-like protein
MEKNWIRIFTSSNYYKSEMIKQALAGNDIDSVLLNKQDSSYPSFGNIEVYVHQENFSDAIEILILNQYNL